jgi:predicted NBD/HSP70 family sugar kinase
VRNPPVVLGLDFGGTKVAIAVCDLAGNRLAATSIAAAALADGGRPDARVIFDRSVRAARELLAATAPGSELAAVGAATFGIPFEDRVDLAPAIEGWESLPLGRELRAAFEGAEVRMATDAKAGAAAELRWGALNGCDPAVYLNLGTGLAAAIIAGGRVVSGGNGAAGEIGYNLRAISDVGVPLGQRVPLEGMVSGLGLARQAGGASRGSSAAPALTAADIFAAGPENPELDDLLSAFAAELAFHLVNLAICVNPVRIAVGGGIVRSWDRLRPQLAQALTAGVPFPPELVVARFPYEAPLLGAVALAVEAARGRQRQQPDTTHQDTMIMDTMA